MNHQYRGATLVVGPAGTGKTTWLQRRNIELIEAGETGILFLVPNRRSARALQERILRGLGRSTGDVRVSTWHAFALSLLRMYYDRLGYARDPGLLTAPDQFALMRDMLDEPAERDHWAAFPKQRALQGFVHELREFVLRAQDAMEEPKQLEERARFVGREDLAEAARFFRRYLDRIDELCMLDAANAITRAVQLLNEHPDVAAAVRAEVGHVLVDDYQDVTVAQEQLLRALTAEADSVAVAADPDAAVFGFRVSPTEAVERFRADFGPREEILAEVHRGTPERRAWLFDHRTEEAEAIAREARRLRTREGIGWGGMAVIVRRYGGATRAIRSAFERGGVPYVVVGENRPLAAEPALRPMLDLVRAALRSHELDELLPGLLGSPVVGLDPYDVRALRREARLGQRTMQDVLMAPPGTLPERVRAALDDLRLLIDDIRDMAVAEKRPDDLFFSLWNRLPMYRRMVEENDHEALDAVAAFARAVERFTDRHHGHATVEGFLDALQGVGYGPEPWNMPEERRPDAVRIMTAHHAVGAEFDAVFVAGCVEGDFPDPHAPHPMLDIRDLLAPADPFARLRGRLADEKRLFAVATSRARTHLILTAARESSQREALDPSPLVPASGLSWERPEPAIDALSRADAVAAARRVLRSADATAAQRAEAFDLLTRLPGVDPDAWWFERDWTDPGTPMFNGEELKTSYSRLSVYDNCRLQYLYQVELGLDPETSHAMLVGTWIHDIVDKAASGEIERTEEALLAALEERWDPAIFEGPAIEDRRKRDCADMLRAWLACDGDMKVLATEVGFAFPVEGALVRGRIDALVRIARSMVRVIDYKTARWAKRPDELEEDLQLAIYNLAMRRDPDLVAYGTPKVLELAYLGTVWRNGFKRPSIDPSKQEDYEARTEATITGFVRGIRAEEFTPNADAECRYCSFKTLCPVWPQGDEANL